MVATVEIKDEEIVGINKPNWKEYLEVNKTQRDYFYEVVDGGPGAMVVTTPLQPDAGDKGLHRMPGGMQTRLS